MAALTGLTPGATYKSLIKFNDNNPVGAGLKYFSDGDGNNLPIAASFSAVGVKTTSPGAMFGIQGTGTTAATASFKAMNSAGTTYVRFDDDGNFYIVLPGATSKISGISFNSYSFRSANGASKIDVDGGAMDLYDGGGALRFRVQPTYGWLNAPMAIGTNAAPNAAALLDLNYTTSKGVRIMNMTDAQITAIASPVSGLLVYSTTQNVLAFYDGTNWRKVSHSLL